MQCLRSMQYEISYTFHSSYSIVVFSEGVFVGCTVARTGVRLFLLVPIYYMNQSASFTSSSGPNQDAKNNVPCGLMNQLNIKATPNVTAKLTNTVCVNFPTVSA